jgi:hypothetical protein
MLTVYWTLAGLIPHEFSQLKIFLLFIMIDILATQAVYPGAINQLFDSIMNKSDEPEE